MSSGAREQDDVDGSPFDAVAGAGRRRGAVSGASHEIAGERRIVGCGVISHPTRGRGRFDTFEIVACADLDDARRDAVAAEHALEPMTVDELLTSPAIDIVLNLTPPRAHADVTRAALEAGKHVYSEKPLAVTSGDAIDLVRLAESRGSGSVVHPTSSSERHQPHAGARGGCHREPLQCRRHAFRRTGALAPRPDIFHELRPNRYWTWAYYLSAMSPCSVTCRDVAGSRRRSSASAGSR